MTESGLARWSTTVRASGASTETTEANEERATAAVAWSRIRSSELFTSSDPKVLRSVKVTLGRNVRVTVSPSGDAVHAAGEAGHYLAEITADLGQVKRQFVRRRLAAEQQTKAGGDVVREVEHRDAGAPRLAEVHVVAVPAELPGDDDRDDT